NMQSTIPIRRIIIIYYLCSGTLPLASTPYQEIMEEIHTKRSPLRGWRRNRKLRLSHPKQSSPIPYSLSYLIAPGRYPA
uniref:Uncharacterized protein n=1 Tax=Callorhinchus milii TaxID=7868 RepID=A0A4W3HE66_CALMI